MTVTLPSLERVVVTYLNTLSLDAEFIGTKVAPLFDDPWIMVQDLGSTQGGEPAWLYETLIQIDCYGSNGSSGAAEALELHNDILAVMPGALTSNECTVTQCKVNSLGRVNDTTHEPALPRRILQATIKWHPS